MLESKHGISTNGWGGTTRPRDRPLYAEGEDRLRGLARQRRGRRADDRRGRSLLVAALREVFEITLLTSGSSTPPVSLHLHGTPAPHTQPRSACQVVAGRAPVLNTQQRRRATYRRAGLIGTKPDPSD